MDRHWPNDLAGSAGKAVAQGRRRWLGLAMLTLPYAVRAAASLPHVSDRRLPGTTIRVGLNQRIRSIGGAARIAQSGDTVEVEAGDYVGDVAVWERDGVRVVGVNGRPRLLPQGTHAEGKGVFVVRAQGVTVENLDFIGARVPDHYGSAIRLERGSLRVVNCRFADNEFAILTANDPKIVLEVDGCEFSGLVDNSGRDGALAHSLYAGAIDVLLVRRCYFHHGAVGHLLKSRARLSDVRYNRLTDEGGLSSYEMEFPDGGLAVVVGNIIQQGARTENPTIVSYGAENLRWPQNRMDLLFNTIVNSRTGSGSFVTARSQGAEIRMRHNVLVGPGSIDIRGPADIAQNVRADLTEFANPAQYDFRPRLIARWVGSASALEHPFPDELLPTMEYRHPVTTRALNRTSRLQPLSPGALQSAVN